MGNIERFKFAVGADSGDWINPWATPEQSRARPPVPWTADDVTQLLASIYPPASGRPGDQSALRQQLSSAFLAGVAQAQEERAGEKPGAMAAASVRVGRALLKNRASLQADRVWHAFMAGLRLARGPGDPRTAGIARTDPEALKLFIRQPFTESGQEQKALIEAVLERIAECDGAPRRFDFLTGRSAESADTFRASFEAERGEAFAPHAFRTHRLNLLATADAFVNIRVGMSESSAFELSYHVFRGACTPVLFLVWKHAPIKTTLLKDLDRLCDVTYLEFEHPDELRQGIADFFQLFGRSRHPVRPMLDAVSG